jgi:hypothetical protein
MRNPECLINAAKENVDLKNVRVASVIRVSFVTRS